jgi:lipopolysaccharide export system protein LptA
MMAQQPGHATDFRTHQDYEGPNLNQKKTEFSGKDASPLDGPNKVLVKGADMRNFREDGSLIMSAQAPECVYDVRQKLAHSPGPLQMRTGDGKFFIEGVGFLWNEGESSLQLSNRVHSILHSESQTNGQSPTETVIYADRFDYDLKTGVATYRGHVKVNDPKLKLTSEILIANLATAPAFQPGDIMDLQALRNALAAPAPSDKVSEFVSDRLSPGTEKLLSTIGPGTEPQLRKSLAEDLNQIIQTGTIYDAGRFAGVKLSPDTSDLLAKSPKGPDLIRLNRALLQDAYPQAISHNEMPQPSGRPDSIVASNNVVIDYNENGGEATHATGEKAVYTRKISGAVTNELMELSGNPRMERTNGWMTADLITVDQTAGMIHGAGNYHSVFKKQEAKDSKTNAAPAGDTEIFCDTFDYNTKTRVAFYNGHVRVDDPQMKMTGEWLQASLPEKGGRPDHIVAETNVAIDFIENNERTHATGERAVYDMKVVGKTTNEVMQLTGNPTLERTNGWLTADLLVMDRTAALIHGIGNHHSIIKKQTPNPPGPATADTEIFSDKFDYDTKTRVAVYRGTVRVIDPEMKLNGSIATVWLPEKGGRPDRIVAETNVVIDFFGSPLFTPGDIADLPVLTSKLKQPAAPDLVSHYMSTQLSTATREQFSKYKGGRTNQPLQQALVQDFNRIIQAGPIYDSQRFAAVKLQPATSNVLAQGPKGLDQVWLNRKLLLDAYPTELSRGGFMESGEKTHATGQTAVYTYSVTGSKTNETVVLTGNPMLGRPTSWTTADKIILDRASGRIRSAGHSYTWVLPSELSKTNAPAAVRRAAN